MALAHRRRITGPLPGFGNSALAGLVERLQRLAPEFLKVEDEVKAKREAVSTPPPPRLRRNKVSRKN